MTPDDYERFVQQVIAELFGAEVHHQKLFTGRVSQREIKVDLALMMKVGGAHFLVIIECKHYGSTVGVNDVEEFHSKLDDIGAHKGIIVTTKGYQEGAIKTAKGRGIALALLTKEPQRGEMQYVVNTASATRPTSYQNTSLLQGNIRGLLDNYGGGARFESYGQLYGMLCCEFMGRVDQST